MTQAHSEGTEARAPTLCMKVCGKCGSRFSGDARFCPFDAEPLGAALTGEGGDALIGTLVDGRYDVLAVLGEGGMGKVYRVRHRAIERLFALKVLRADLAADSDLGVRFTREAKAAASITHPNVVQITDFGSLPSRQPFFVMELLPGTSLSDLLSTGGPMSIDRGVRLLSQVVDALAAAHAVGVVHRDLKPDNVVVFRTPMGETAKVLDFGLAKVAGQSRLTREGLVFGTPHYMSPEQASGAVADHRTDIYALGVMMYQVFTGRVPFEADTYMGVLTQHIYVEPAPPSELLGSASLGAVEQIVLRCLEKKPERRFQSMNELRDELLRVTRFDESGGVTIKPVELRDPKYAPQVVASLSSRAEVTAPRAARPPSRILLPLLGVSVVVVSAVVAFAALSFHDRTGEPPAAPTASTTPVATAAPALVLPSPSAAPEEPTAVPLSAIPVDPAPSAPSSLPRARPGHTRTSAAAGGETLVPPRDRPVTPVATAVTGGAPVEAAKYSKKQNKSDDGVIVDPWAH